MRQEIIEELMSIESVEKLQEVQKFVFCTSNPPPFKKKPQQKGKIFLRNGYLE